MPIQIILFWYAKSILFIVLFYTTLQTPTHNYIIPYTAHLHTHIMHTHTNTTHHTKRLLTRTKTSPIDKPNHWNTPTNGTIWTCTIILSLSPWFQERLHEYTTWQTPTHNLRHCHTSHKTGFRWSMLGILLWVHSHASILFIIRALITPIALSNNSFTHIHNDLIYLP